MTNFSNYLITRVVNGLKLFVPFSMSGDFFCYNNWMNKWQNMPVSCSAKIYQAWSNLKNHLEYLLYSHCIWSHPISKVERFSIYFVLMPFHAVFRSLIFPWLFLHFHLLPISTSLDFESALVGKPCLHESQDPSIPKAFQILFPKHDVWVHCQKKGIQVIIIVIFSPNHLSVLLKLFVQLSVLQWQWM